MYHRKGHSEEVERPVVDSQVSKSSQDCDCWVSITSAVSKA